MSYLYDAYLSDPENDKLGVIHNDSVSGLITTSRKPTAVCVDLNQMDVWVTNVDGGQITVKNGAPVSKVLDTGEYSNTITRYRNGIPQDDIAVGKNPMGICSVPGNIVYVTNYGSNTVSKVVGGKTVKTINVGRGPRGICSTKDGKLYVANYLDNTVTVIENDVPIATIKVGYNPIGICAGRGTFVYVACSGSNYVSQINKLERIADIQVGHMPYGICCDFHGIVWVTNYLDDTVSKIANGQQVLTILVGDGPRAISFNKDNEKYVANYLGGTVSKIVGNIVVDTIPGIQFPSGLGDFIGGMAYNTHVYIPPAAGAGLPIGMSDLDPSVQYLLNKIASFNLPVGDTDVTISSTDTSVATLDQALALLLKPENQMYFMIADADIYTGPNDIHMPIPADGEITKIAAFLAIDTTSTDNLKFKIQCYKDDGTNTWNDIEEVSVLAGGTNVIKPLTTPYSVKAGDRIRIYFTDANGTYDSMIFSVYYRRQL